MQALKTKVENAAPRKVRVRPSPRGLRQVADRMVASNDSTEVTRLKKELEGGFYGDPVQA